LDPRGLISISRSIKLPLKIRVGFGSSYRVIGPHTDYRVADGPDPWTPNPTSFPPNSWSCHDRVTRTVPRYIEKLLHVQLTPSSNVHHRILAARLKKRSQIVHKNPSVLKTGEEQEHGFVVSYLSLHFAQVHSICDPRTPFIEFFRSNRSSIVLISLSIPGSGARSLDGFHEGFGSDGPRDVSPFYDPNPNQLQ